MAVFWPLRQLGSDLSENLQYSSSIEVYIIEAGACRDATREKRQLAAIYYAYRGKVLVESIGFGDVMG